MTVYKAGPEASLAIASHPKRITSDVERVVSEFVALIESRHYAPGERLPSERDLAERFAVGRGVIREATTTLESMRYIVRRPNSGLFLRSEPDATSIEALVLFSDLGLPLEPDVIADCSEVRRIIEVQAIVLACSRRDRSDLHVLRSSLADFGEAIGSERVASLDYEFHMSIFRATHNNILVRLVTPFYMMAKNRRAVFFADIDRCKASHSQHIEMVNAIESRDADDAARIMTDHIGRVEKHFLVSNRPLTQAVQLI